MKFITQAYVKAEAKKSKKAAIKCSILHHEQLLAASYEELRKKHISLKTRGLIGGKYCALCQRFLLCRQCPLAKAGNICGVVGSLWEEVRFQYNMMYKTDKREYYTAFRAAERKLIAALKELL